MRNVGYNPTAMEQTKPFSPLELLNVLGRRMWTILTVAAFCVLVESYILWKSTPIYRATAQIEIVRRPPKVTGFEDLMFYYAGWREFYPTQYKLIVSRRVLEAVARRLNLAGEEDFRGVTDIVRVLQGKVRAEPVEQSSLVNIHCDGPRKDRVSRIANEVAQSYMVEVSARRREAYDIAVGSLEKELPRLYKRVEEAEAVLRRYQREHSMLSSEDLKQMTISRLSQLNRSLTAAEIERIGAEAAYTTLLEAGQDEEKLRSIPQVARDETVRAIEREARVLAQSRLDLLKNLDAGHADVLAVDRKLFELIAEKRKALARIGDGLKTEYEVARRREEMLREVLDEEKNRATELNQILVEYGRLKKNVEHAKELYDPLVSRRAETKVAVGLEMSLVRMIEPARPPSAPIRPRRALGTMAALVVGLLLGLVAAVFREMLDQTVKTPDEVTRFLGQQVFGVIPRMSRLEERKRGRVCELKPESSASEAYRSMRAALTVSGVLGRKGVVLVTSAENGEGKTTAASNLAIAFAQAGRRVLLVDADMRRSSLGKLYDLDGVPGLAECLASETEPEAAECKVSGLEIMPSGERAPNPAELLGGEALEGFLSWARERYDLVILDSPPVGVVSDAIAVAAKADLVLQVILCGKTSIPVLKRGSELLSVGARKMGAVLNSYEALRFGHYDPYLYYDTKSA